jgi:hypothetical protein
MQQRNRFAALLQRLGQGGVLNQFVELTKKFFEFQGGTNID